MIALQLKDENKAVYEIEKQRLKSILDNNQYETLMKYGSNEMGASLLFTGDVEAIDEIIIFASDSEKVLGFLE